MCLIVVFLILKKQTNSNYWTGEKQLVELSWNNVARALFKLHILTCNSKLCNDAASGLGSNRLHLVELGYKKRHNQNLCTCARITTLYESHNTTLVSGKPANLTVSSLSWPLFFIFTVVKKSFTGWKFHRYFDWDVCG